MFGKKKATIKALQEEINHLLAKDEKLFCERIKAEWEKDRLAEENRMLSALKPRRLASIDLSGEMKKYEARYWDGERDPLEYIDSYGKVLISITAEFYEPIREMFAVRATALDCGGNIVANDYLVEHQNTLVFRKSAFDEFIKLQEDVYGDANPNDEPITLTKASGLPKNWIWRHCADGSGSLLSPDQEAFVSYDRSTGEYCSKIDERWSCAIGQPSSLSDVDFETFKSVIEESISVILDESEAA